MTYAFNANIGLVLPAIILGGVALVVLIVEAFGDPARTGRIRQMLTWLTLAGFIGAGASALIRWDQPLRDDAGMLRLDHFSVFLTGLFCLGGALTVLLSDHYLESVGTAIGEYYSLLLFCTLGAYIMAAGTHLIMVFLGLEILSVAIYPLAGFLRRDRRSNEASIKYFLLGAFSSAFFLYGTALIYGAVGLRYLHTGLEVAGANASRATSGLALLRFDVIADYVLHQSEYPAIFWGGVALLLVSFCFKAALAPFHQWTPDAYDGAPTPISAFMGSVVKAAAFAPFFRVFLEVLGRKVAAPNSVDAYNQWVIVVAAIAILTMTWGNLSAVAEPSMKRMLAYSSVAHAGYIAVALVSESFPALIYYLSIYLLMVVGSFGCVALVKKRNGDEARYIEEWSGLGIRYPWFGAAMAIFLFALAGFPPTAGFMGKMYIFRAALETGVRGPYSNGYVALVAIALINSLFSVYYYVRVVLAMYRPAGPEPDQVVVQRDSLAGFALALCALGVIVLGIYPQFLFGIWQ